MSMRPWKPGWPTPIVTFVLAASAGRATIPSISATTNRFMGGIPFDWSNTVTYEYADTLTPGVAEISLPLHHPTGSLPPSWQNGGSFRPEVPHGHRCRPTEIGIDANG